MTQTKSKAKKKPADIIRSVLLGRRYNELESIDDQVRYMTMNSIFMVAMVPLLILGITLVRVDLIRAVTDFGIVFICLLGLIAMRTKISLKIIPVFPVSVFGAYCLYLLYTGNLTLWVAIWFYAFPLLIFFLCRMTLGLIESIIGLAAAALILFFPLMKNPPDLDIRLRYIIGYVLILVLTAIYERISVLKDRKEAALKADLSHESQIVQIMKDNIHQGIFLMDAELKILPQYSQPLISILSYYDSELTGKNFLDILAASLDGKQLQTMKGYFSMVFSKTKSQKVLESVNPISEFEYKIDDRMKTLSTKFHLIEQKNTDPMIIGIIQDVTREKEFEQELLTQKKAQELEMKNMFDVIQIDPLVFQDFIEDTEANFNYINTILKDRSLTEKQVVTKFFQNVHAMKSNALVLGLETFGKKLHLLEDEIKKVSSQTAITEEDILGLAMGLEIIMQEKDSYLKTINRIEKFKTSNQMDSVLVHTLSKAVERISAETMKKVEIKAGLIDMKILETSLRKPIKDILFQCVRNSIYHGI